MNEKYYSVNREGHSIRCKLYGGDGPAQRAIVFGHGFGGHKDNRAAKRFAEYAVSKNKGTAVAVFDWPCHGEDAKKKLRLEDCDAYLTLVTEDLRERTGAKTLYGYATSFGGYLFLKYLSEHPSPFEKTALRCPVVDMYRAMTERIMDEEALEKTARGKEVLAGFDRKIRIGPDFLRQLREEDISERDLSEHCDDVLILHGTADEIVPIEGSREFAERNYMDFIPIEGADHRFKDPKKMDEAIRHIMNFFAFA